MDSLKNNAALIGLKCLIFPSHTDENREDIAVFLIRSGCDVNAVRKPGPGGAGGDEAHDLMTPLHLCSSWGLEDTAQALVEHGAKVNAKVVTSGVLESPLGCI